MSKVVVRTACGGDTILEYGTAALFIADRDVDVVVEKLSLHKQARQRREVACQTNRRRSFMTAFLTSLSKALKLRAIISCGKAF